jgi:two-component system chemotaxis response regulator CheY
MVRGGCEGGEISVARQLPMPVGSRIATHLREPARKTEKLAALIDKKTPEVAGAHLFGVLAGKRLQPPAQERTGPRTQTMAASCHPQESSAFKHSTAIIGLVPLLMFASPSPIEIQKDCSEGGMRVLIVDDSALMRRIVAKALREAGLVLDEVVEAGNGADGIRALEQSSVSFDLILCDVHMPALDGLGFLRERAARGLNSAPVVMVTADAGDPLIQQAIASGAQGFISKPFSAEQIRERVMVAFAESA